MTHWWLWLAVAGAGAWMTLRALVRAGVNPVRDPPPWTVVAAVVGFAATCDAVLLAALAAAYALRRWLLVCACCAWVAGCDNQVGSATQPVVQIGPAGGGAPAVEISPRVASDDVRETTSQPVAANAGPVKAGRDAKLIQVPISASGSGWPAAATAIGMAAAIVGALLLAGKLRATAKRHGLLTRSAVAVAGAIKGMEPGIARDGLLTTIEEYLGEAESSPARRAWDALSDEHGMRAKRQRRPARDVRQK